MTNLAQFGWAPGGYTIRCGDCPPGTPIDQNMGAKRSWRCEHHAKERAADVEWAGVNDFQRFNVNHFVRVKLNDKGMAILRERHEEIQRRAPAVGEFREPKVDERGYAGFALWAFMAIFGPHIHLGGEPPFETEILIPRNPK